MSIDTTISRSEKKRQAKNIEKLAKELAALSPSEISRLPVDDSLKEEISAVGSLKSGAYKRQLKYIAKELRNSDPEPLLIHLAEIKGSRLKEKREMHTLEKLRDAILTDAIASLDEARQGGYRLDASWQSGTVETAARELPDIDAPAIIQAAIGYAATRKPAYSREIFRILKAAQQRKEMREKLEGTQSDTL